MSKPETVDGASIDPKFSAFDIITVDYKKVNGVGIPVSILIPKQLKAGKHPSAVRWHGGGFGTGHRLFADWYADWSLALPLAHNAITLTPDYRLLPEATGLNILADAQDFYTWLFTPGNLSALLPDSITPDLNGILVTGESAGGWHALQAGFLTSPGQVGAIISHYPMIDMRSAHFSSAPPPEKQVFDPPQPQMDPAVLTKHISSLKGGEVVPSRMPPAGQEYVLVMVQQGLYGKYFGTDERLYPLEMLDKVKAFPPTWILHGEEDSVVPVEGTKEFVIAVGKKLPGMELHMTYREGAEHGFDLTDDGAGWREEGIKFIEKFWPAK